MKKSEDYLAFKKEKKKLLDKLAKSKCKIYAYYESIIKVLDYISLDYNPQDEDINIIFQAGYDFLFDMVMFLENLIKLYFNGSIDKLIEYQDLIYLYIYVDDLIITSDNNKLIKESEKKDLQNILSKIEKILETKSPCNSEIVEKITDEINDVSDDSLITTAALFDEMVDTMGI